MEELRRVRTPGGEICYILCRKGVKNLNLRVDRTGTVRLSVPPGCPVQRADGFVSDQWSWIAAHSRKEERNSSLPPLPPRETCLELLTRAVDRVCPLVRPLGVVRPVVKIRNMRSQWGNCHWAQGYITLNTALCLCPKELQDYVALHELVHFLHHDHQQGFYAVMDALMPDWKERRRRLRSFETALAGK